MRFDYDGKKIREAREALLMSREALSRRTRMSVATIAALEFQQRKSIDERVLEAVAYALQVRPETISSDYYPPVMPYTNRVYYNPEILKARRAELGLTLKEVGAAAGVSLEAVHKLERKNTAWPETVRRVAIALSLMPQDVAPIFEDYPTPQDRQLYEGYHGPNVFTYPEAGPPHPADRRPPEIK